MAIEVSQKIYDYISTIYGKDSADKYLEFISQDSSQYIRVNLAKISKEDLSKVLFDKYGIVTSEVPLFHSAMKIVKGNDKIGKTIEQILGFYYIQGLSSMLPPLVLQPSSNDIVLDLCSAPGSKTTQMAELMNNRGTLIVNEIDMERIKSLVFNLDRMNVINTGVIHSKGEILSKIYDNHFTKILVDAPCSGLGIIQKKGEVSKWWSLGHVDRLHDLQLRLLIAAIKMTRVGGEIVYSTCTLSIEENELVIDKVLDKYPVELEEIKLPVSFRCGFTEYEGKPLNPSINKSIRILPWEIDSDGFYLAKLRKTGETESPEKDFLRDTIIRIVNYNHEDILPYLSYLEEHFGVERNEFENYKYIFRGHDIYFITKDWNDENIGLFNRIGLKLGTIDKKDRITFHSQGAQIFDKHITKFIYDLKNDDELKNYLTGWKIKNIDIPNGQYVVKSNGILLGTAVKTEEGLKSRFPRTKRTQNFEF